MSDESVSEVRARGMVNDEEEPWPTWEWVQRAAGPEGFGNYPARSEALLWAVDEIRRLRLLLGEEVESTP